jgi:hypothetical protein
MSNKNNVNPDHYKVAGRDRQGEAVVHERQRQSLARDEARRARQAKRRPAPRKPGAAGAAKVEGEEEG